MGMKRERTVVSHVTDAQKEEEWKKLIKQKDDAEKNVSQEQRKQDEMVSHTIGCFVSIVIYIPMD